jgi:hypothetical protein
VWYRTLRVMLEIKLCCDRHVRVGERHQVEHGLWFPDTPLNRDKLMHAVEAGNKLYGPETYWIEERQA